MVTPFLPGDSLLFAVGALSAVDNTGTLHAPLMWALVCAAAILGNTSNYAIGRAIGPRAFSGRLRLLTRNICAARKPSLRATVRSPSCCRASCRCCGPSRLRGGRRPDALCNLPAYNIVGGLAWGTLFIWGGFLFGNIPLVRNNFGLVTLGIIGVSLVPMAWALVRDRQPAVS